MQKRKSFRPSTVAILALVTVFVSSCNRSVGCPANNMSIDDNLVEFLSTLVSVLF